MRGLHRGSLANRGRKMSENSSESTQTSLDSENGACTSFYTAAQENLSECPFPHAKGRFLLSECVHAYKLQVYKFKFDLQPGSLTDQVAGEH